MARIQSTFDLKASLSVSRCHYIRSDCIHKRYLSVARNDDSKRHRLRLRHNHDIGSYIKAISKCGNNENRALKIFSTIIDWNLSPDLHTFNALINVASKAQNLSLCWDLLNKMRLKYQIYPNHETYLVLFDTMLKHKQYNDILNEFEDIVQEYKYIHPDHSLLLLTSINQILPITIISCGKLNKIDLAKQLFNQWYNNENNNNNAIINSIISVLATDNVNDAIIFFKDVILNKNNKFMYSDNRAYISLLHSSVDKEEIYEMILKNNNGNNNLLGLDIFNMMLKYYNKNKNWCGSIKIWQHIQFYKTKPDSMSHIFYIQSLVHSNRDKKEIEMEIEAIMKDRSEIINELLAKCMIWAMIEIGLDPNNIFLDFKYKLLILPNISLYNELLYFSIKQLDYKQALDILDEIKKSNLKLNTQTFNTLIYGVSKLNDIDLIDELLQEMNKAQCPMNEYTYLYLLSLYAKNGDIQMCNYYLNQIQNNHNAYPHLINCYANYFSLDNNNNTGNNNEFEFNQCLIYWNKLKSFNKANLLSYILMLKCLKNYTRNIEQHHKILNFTINLFENEFLKLFKTNDNNINNSNNMRVAFNLLLDIFYEINEIELGLKYFVLAESVGIYSTKKTNYKIDIHAMTRYPAIFSVLHFLKSLKQIYDTNHNEKWNEKQYEIITGVGMTSIDWIPVLKPIILDLLNNKLSKAITYHIPSYNQGVILLDPHSLKTYFKTNQSIKLKLDKIEMKTKQNNSSNIQTENHNLHI